MKLCYYHDSEGNFGDDLNAWLWPRVLPDFFDGTCRHGQEFFEENNKESGLFYGIGTILDQRIPPAPTKFVAGSGVGYFSPPQLDKSYRIYFVRGPKSAAKLGIDASLSITDPAILLRKFLPQAPCTHKVSLMMHCDTAKSGYWEQIAGELGIHYIDPRSTDPIAVIQQLIASEYVITESLHGAIIADAYGIPWVSINSMPHINAFKWHDWCASVGLSYEPTNLISIYSDKNAGIAKTLLNKAKTRVAKSQLKKILSDKKSCNSHEQVVQGHLDHMQEQLAKLRKDAESLGLL
ncbi:MAG: polysaccharide pyruvyl transferase family protein [Porticoccaceae bacterium]